MDRTPPWQEEPPTGSGRRRWQLLAAAATIPWLVVAVLLTRGGQTTDVSGAHHPASHPGGIEVEGQHDAERPPDGDVPIGTVPATDAGPHGEVAPPEAAVSPAPEPPGATGAPSPPEGWPDPAVTVGPRVTDGDAATVATAVARAWLTDRGAPDLEGPETARSEAGYLEHVSVRRIEVLGPRLAVVTLGVLLLEREEDRYARVRAADLVVPLALSDDRAHPAGDPWWSPREVDLSPRPPQADEETSPAVASEVTTALAEAGYRDVQVTGVARGADDLLVATVTAETVEGRRLDTALWLHETRHGPRVLGIEP